MKRPVWSLIFESHPSKKGVRYMDANIHPGSLGLLPIIDPDKYSHIETYIKSVMGHNDKPLSFVYRYPSYVVSFFNAWNAQSKVAFVRKGEGGVSDDPRLSVMVHLDEQMPMYRKVIFEKYHAKLNNYYPVGSWILLPQEQRYNEIPSKEVLSIQLVRALTSVPRFLINFVPQDHILRRSWIFRVTGNKLELVFKPEIMEPSPKTIVRAIDGFITAGSGLKEYNVEFPTTEENARILIENFDKPPSGAYISIAPLIEFPEDNVILYKQKPYAYHVRPLYNPEDFTYYGIALKIVEFKPNSINNSSAGVASWNILNNHIYTPNLKGGPYTYIDVRKGFPQVYDYHINEINANLDIPLLESMAKTLLEEMKQAYMKLLQYFQEYSLKEIYQEYRRDIPPAAKTMIAQVGLTRKKVEEL